MSLNTKLKKVIPQFIWIPLTDLRDRLLHRGKYNFRLCKDRESPFEYTTRYDHRNLRKARKSILWDDDWKGATRATIAILQELDLLSGSRNIVDYGGGIGRISRAVLESSDGRVILVDRSPEMRAHALRYVPKKLAGSGRFTIWSDTEFLKRMGGVEGGIDLILFIESLQHIPEPILDELFPKVISSLSPGGRVFVLGNPDLDVDLRARRHQTLIGDFLKRHIRVVREDVWEEWERGGRKFSFRHPRYSFLCRKEE